MYFHSTIIGYNNTQHSELFSQTSFPAVVSQELSSNGLILAQPSPYKNFPSYPTSVILSPTKNRMLHQKCETIVNSVPSMSPLVTVASGCLSHLNINAVSQPSTMSHPPIPAAPPPLDIPMQPHPPNIQNLQNGGIPNSTPSHSNIIKEAQLPYNSNSDSKQVVGNKPAGAEDPSAALIEQHNVRVVPAVLSFGSLSSFSLSTTSVSQHSSPQSSAQVNNNMSIISSTNTPSLFKPSDVYNSSSIGHHGSTISWLHPNRALFADTNNSSQLTSSSSVQSDVKVIN